MSTFHPCPLQPSRDATSSTTPPTRAKTTRTKNPKSGKIAWPTSLPDRIKAVLAEVEKRGTTPFTPEDIARTFKRAQTPQVIEILETLCTFGRAHPGKQKGSYTK